MAYIDLQPCLRDWPYEPDKISVRKILGADGAVRIQMRVELGIIQMEAVGRPDGVRPQGHESLLAMHRSRLGRHEERNGTPLGFGLTQHECHDLRVEASLYYRRYVANFVLEEFEQVVQDTAHNLAIFDLCRDHALEADDRVALDEFRPYVMMMLARGRAYQALEEGEPSSALAHVNRGIIDIKTFYDGCEGADGHKSSEELKILRVLAQELSTKVPEDSVLVARKALRDAIDQERFEEAARLRDLLKNRFGQEA